MTQNSNSRLPIMFKTLIAEFWADLRAQKTRALLTIFAVMWGTLTVVLLLAFGEGLKRAVVRGTLGAGNEIFMIFGGETSRAHDGLPKGRRIRLVEEDLALIETVRGVDLVSPSYGRGGVTLEAGAVRTTSFMEGVHPAFEELRTMYPTAGGRFLNAHDEAMKRRVVFLGDSIARRLFPGESAVGRTLTIDGLPFTVVGTMQKKLQTGMNNGPDADRVIIPASVFRTVYGNRYVSQLLVRPRSAAEAEAVKAGIYEVLSRKYRFHPADRRALGIWDMVEELRMSRLITGGIQIFLGIVGALTLLVAGVGVANIMYVVVRERTREIGVRRALGARRHHIVGQVVFEALALALSGGLAGLLLAAAIVLGVDAIPDTGNMAMEFLANPKLSWQIGLATVAILCTVGLLAGVFPARRAARLDPVEALRYE
jgi:putative ABC transport system permease protein